MERFIKYTICLAVGFALGWAAYPSEAKAHFPGHDAMGVVMLPDQPPIIRWFGDVKECRASYSTILQQSGLGGANYWSEKDRAYVFKYVNALCIDVSGSVGT